MAPPDLSKGPQGSSGCPFGHPMPPQRSPKGPSSPRQGSVQGVSKGSQKLPIAKLGGISIPTRSPRAREAPERAEVATAAGTQWRHSRIRSTKVSRRRHGAPQSPRKLHRGFHPWEVGPDTLAEAGPDTLAEVLHSSFENCPGHVFQLFAHSV